MQRRVSVHAKRPGALLRQCQRAGRARACAQASGPRAPLTQQRAHSPDHRQPARALGLPQAPQPQPPPPPHRAHPPAGPPPPRPSRCARGAPRGCSPGMGWPTAARKSGRRVGARGGVAPGRQGQRGAAGELRVWLGRPATTASWGSTGPGGQGIRMEQSMSKQQVWGPAWHVACACPIPPHPTPLPHLSVQVGAGSVGAQVAAEHTVRVPAKSQQEALPAWTCSRDAPHNSVSETAEHVGDRRVTGRGVRRRTPGRLGAKHTAQSTRRGAAGPPPCTATKQ